jgi:nucleoside-diphosphate-sugar epimerase
LKGAGHEVRVVDIKTENNPKGLYDYRSVNILDRGRLIPAMRGMDLVIHLAAKHRFFGISEEEFSQVNEGGTRFVLAAMEEAKVKKLIFYSTVAVYGDSNGHTHEEMEPRPSNPYGISKLAAEGWVKKWAAEDWIRSAIIIRPTVVFGPYNKGNIYRLIRQIYHRAYLPVGIGDNIKSIAYVENLVAATRFLIEREIIGFEIFNYSDTPDLPYRKIVNLIYSALGRKPPGYHLPFSPMAQVAGFMDSVTNKLGIEFSIKAAMLKMNKTTYHRSDKIRHLGFIPKYSSVEGLKHMVEWYLTEVKRKKQERNNG